MINKIGTLTLPKDVPCLYFILKDDYLYVGETKRYAVERWAEHVKRGGTFSERLLAADPEVYESSDEVKFYGYACWIVATQVPESERKAVMRHVEHLVQGMAYCTRSLFPKYTIISNTSRTAVPHCRFPWAKTVAQKVVSEFSKDLENSM